MSQMAVSIIVPVYNVEKYIGRCVCSLFEQRSDNFEYIFVNDCSIDKSIEILQQVMEKYPHRASQVKIINHEINKGVSASRNTGLVHATGKYIGWVDSDDWVDDEMFGAMYQMAEDTNADIVWCDFYSCYGNETKDWILKRQACNEDRIALLKGLLNGGLHGSLCNSIARRQLYIDHKIVFSPDINLMEDKMVSIQLRYYAQKCTYIPNAYYFYNQTNRHSITSSSKNEINNLDSGIKSIQIIQAFLESNKEGIDFSEDFNYAKLAFKDYYFHSFTVQGFKIWKQIFPEANAYFFNSRVIPLKDKLIGRMVINDYWWLLKLCIRFRNLIKHSYR